MWVADPYKATASTVIGQCRQCARFPPAGAPPATLAEQLNQQLRERDGESKTTLSAHLSLIQDDEFAGNIVA
ncbi:hypothetical protein ACNKHL_14710 [Shigella flexneri]